MKILFGWENKLKNIFEMRVKWDSMMLRKPTNQKNCNRRSLKTTVSKFQCAMLIYENEWQKSQ